MSCALLYAHFPIYQPDMFGVFGNVFVVEPCLAAQHELVPMEPPVFPAECIVSGFTPLVAALFGNDLQHKGLCWSRDFLLLC